MKFKLSRRRVRPTRPLCALVRTALLLGALAIGLPAAHAAPPPLVAAGVKRSEHHYTLPTVRLTGADGRPRALAKVLDDGRPIVLTFLYSSCNTICPVTSQVLTEFVRLLGSEAARVNVLSISIDPDHDTVARLADHARRAGLAGAFYTGDPAASEAVQRAFEAWRGDKMNHEPVLFLRSPGTTSWVRLDGLVSPQRLLGEYRQLNPS